MEEAKPVCHGTRNKHPLRELREAQMLTKSELARKAGVSVITIARIEKGEPCRLATKRKILIALGIDLSNGAKVFENPD